MESNVTSPARKNVFVGSNGQIQGPNRAGIGSFLIRNGPDSDLYIFLLCVLTGTSVDTRHGHSDDKKRGLSIGCLPVTLSKARLSPLQLLTRG